MRVSVVICTYNRSEKIKRCLASILNQKYTDFEIIVVDDHSDHELKEVLNTMDASSNKINCFRNERNMGLSFSRNKGAELSSGDIVVFIDDDCVAEEEWLSEMVRPFEDPRVAVVFGRIKDPIPVNIAMVAAKGHYKRFEKEGACDGVASGGGNMAVRKKVYLSTPICGFTLEDWELAHKVMESGRSIYYNPNAIVLHEHYHDARTLLRQRFRYGVGQTWFRKQYKPFPLNMPTCFLLLAVMFFPVTFFAPLLVIIEFFVFCGLLLYLFFKDFKKHEKTISESIVSFPVFLLIAISECIGRVAGLFKKPKQINFAKDSVKPICIGTNGKRQCE